MVQSHSAVDDVSCPPLLGVLSQTTNFGSDSMANVNQSGVLGSLLHSARRDLGFY